MNKIAAVILAAGRGTRMGSSEIPKVMHEISCKPIIYHSLKAVKDAGINKVVLVVGYKRELIENYFGDECDYAVQHDQLGTGHAAMMAKDTSAGEANKVIVFYGDCPLYKPETIKALMQEFEKERATIAMLTVVSSLGTDLTGYGRIIRERNGEVREIKEHKDCNEKECEIREWNPGFYIFDGAWLWENIEKISTNNSQKEYYLTDLIAMAKDQNKKVIALPVSEESEGLGINTPQQLREAEEVLKTRG